MATEPTDDSPTGITAFDYRHFAHLPEFQAVSHALNDFVRAVSTDEVPSPQAKFLRYVGDAASALAFMDDCTECQPTLGTYPYAVELDGDSGLTASYRCVNDHTWTCWWSLTAPNLF